MILGIIINLILSLWVIPEYLGKKREIGFAWSLVACLFLTPLIGVIITLVSPKLEEYKKETIAIKKEQSKTDDSLQNLSNLKQKGILTDEEYNQKVNKINAEKDEQELKNSIEYKQLKSLLDSNILTKDEFESKTKLLKVKPKEVVMEDVFYTSNNIEKEVLGNFRVDGVLYSFYHQNILEIDYVNSSVKGKWKKIDDSTLEIKFLIVKTKFYKVQFSNNKISYINKGVKYFGKRVK